MIALFVDLFGAWGFEGLTVAVNSVGSPEGRRRYGDALRAWLAPVRDRLGADSLARWEVNPMRILDTKDPAEQALLRGEWGGVAAPSPLPRMLDVVDDDDRAHFEAVIDGLGALGIANQVDHGLVRGLDYYTRTAFEVHDRSLGAQSALGGGGRYDGLIEALGGPATPSVGFSIGLDRALLVMEQRGQAGDPPRATVYVAAMEGTRTAAMQLARTLRRRFKVDIDLEARSLQAQLKSADRSGASLVVILGEDEWQRGEVAIKDLTTGEQHVAASAALEAALAERLRVRPRTTV
jgi:histidyl-tRNA synthetase